MPFASSISPERRANLRHLKAEFDAAFALVDDRDDRSSPAYRAADLSYRAWIKAVDAVALALLDDLDACEAACKATETWKPADPAPALGTATSIDVDRLLYGTEVVQSAADLIGAGPMLGDRSRKSTPTSRAMGVIGDDRAARLWSRSPGLERQVCLAARAR